MRELLRRLLDQAVELREDRREALRERWKESPGGDRSEGRHQGILDEILAALVAPDLPSNRVIAKDVAWWSPK